MTLGDFLTNGEGNVWVVKNNNPVAVTEIDAIAITKEVATERRYFHFSWYEDRRNWQYLLARKSKDKKRVRRDGVPSVVCINSTIDYVPFGIDDLNKTSLEHYGNIIFFDKKDACDYVIDKITQRKRILNSYIMKINKMKFSIS